MLWSGRKSVGQAVCAFYPNNNSAETQKKNAKAMQIFSLFNSHSTYLLSWIHIYFSYYSKYILTYGVQFCF